MIQPFWLPHQRVISRKERLFCCACVRRVWYRLKDDEAGKRAVEVAEEFADLQRTWRDLAEARDAAYAASETWSEYESVEARQVWESLRAAAECASPENSGQFGVAEMVGSRTVRASREGTEAERATQLARHRDIYGDPDRPVTFDPSWRSAAAVALAQRMYDSRDFSDMQLLADALQAAGCEDADIMGHCRTPGKHVRGCWVVDLILGKS